MVCKLETTIWSLCFFIQVLRKNVYSPLIFSYWENILNIFYMLLFSVCMARVSGEKVLFFYLESKVEYWFLDSPLENIFPNIFFLTSTCGEHITWVFGAILDFKKKLSTSTNTHVKNVYLPLCSFFFVLSCVISSITKNKYYYLKSTDTLKGLRFFHGL